MTSQPKTLRQTVAQQIRVRRSGRGMTQQGLSDRLNQLGAQLDRTTVAKIEAGRREISLSETFSFALALDVAPVHLLVPIDSDEPISLAPNLEAAPHEVRAWIRGAMPLHQDARAYFSAVPMAEFEAAEQALTSWQQMPWRIHEAEEEEER